MQQFLLLPLRRLHLHPMRWLVTTTTRSARRYGRVGAAGGAKGALGPRAWQRRWRALPRPLGCRPPAASCGAPLVERTPCLRAVPRLARGAANGALVRGLGQQKAPRLAGLSLEAMAVATAALPAVALLQHRRFHHQVSWRAPCRAGRRGLPAARRSSTRRGSSGRRIAPSRRPQLRTPSSK